MSLAPAVTTHGCTTRQLLDHPIVGDQQLQAWWRDSRSSDPDRSARGREQLVRHLLRLVFETVAHMQFAGEDLDDLFQDGVLGLLKSFRTYDPAKGASIPGHARRWIVSTVWRERDDSGRLIRAPVHIQVAYRRWRRQAERRFVQHGVVESPSPELDLLRTTSTVFFAALTRPEDRFLWEPEAANSPPENLGEIHRQLAFHLAVVRELDALVAATSRPRIWLQFRQRYGYLTNGFPRSGPEVARHFGISHRGVHRNLMNAWQRVHQHGWPGQQNQAWLFRTMDVIVALQELQGHVVEIVPPAESS